MVSPGPIRDDGLGSTAPSMRIAFVQRSSPDDKVSPLVFEHSRKNAGPSSTRSKKAEIWGLEGPCAKRLPTKRNKHCD